MTKAVIAGSFDPVTYGHIDIFKRAAALFDVVVVCIMVNVNKKGLFSFEERKAFIERAITESSNVSVDIHHGLLIDYAKENGCNVIVKGLRNAVDFDYEADMEFYNRHLASEIETIYIRSSLDLIHVSSSAVKELARYGCSVSDFVPDFVEDALKAKMK